MPRAAVGVSKKLLNSRFISFWMELISRTGSQRISAMSFLSTRLTGRSSDFICVHPIMKSKSIDVKSYCSRERRSGSRERSHDELLSGAGMGSRRRRGWHGSGRSEGASARAGSPTHRAPARAPHRQNPPGGPLAKSAAHRAFFARIPVGIALWRFDPHARAWSFGSPAESAEPGRIRRPRPNPQAPAESAGPARAQPVQSMSERPVIAAGCVDSRAAGAASGRHRQGRPRPGATGRAR